MVGNTGGLGNFAMLLGPFLRGWGLSYVVGNFPTCLRTLVGAWELWFDVGNLGKRFGTLLGFCVCNLQNV